MEIFLDEQEICRKAVETFGIEDQMWMCIEEMSELAKALSKSRRRGIQLVQSEVCEEIADVEIMLQQMRYMFQPSGVGDHCITHDVDVWKKYKLERLEGRIESNKPRGETVTTGDIVEGTAEKFGLRH